MNDLYICIQLLPLTLIASPLAPTHDIAFYTSTHPLIPLWMNHCCWSAARRRIVLILVLFLTLWSVDMMSLAIFFSIRHAGATTFKHIYKFTTEYRHISIYSPQNQADSSRRSGCNVHRVLMASLCRFFICACAVTLR